MKILRCEDSVFPYIAYIPDNCSDRPGLLVQLHGAGERGGGGKELDKVLVHGFSKVADDETLRDCILVMPQCPTGSFWAARVESIRAFIDALMRRYNTDPHRIYLCGLSMGGYGTWYTAMAYPDLFAAILPCCGGGMAWNANVLTMPIWAFHGREDDDVSVTETLMMAEVLERTNPKFRCTIYDGVGHNCWSLAMNKERLQWLLAQHK